MMFNELEANVHGNRSYVWCLHSIRVRIVHIEPLDNQNTHPRWA